MTIFRDFLVWYNNRPIRRIRTELPRVLFRERCGCLQDRHFGSRHCTAVFFKTARKENANFALFDESNKDLYKTVKQNIVGGPSIIFTRHNCARQTRIRGQKSCGAILGFDANALHLQAIGQPMPVGPFVRRLADNDITFISTFNTN